MKNENHTTQIHSHNRDQKKKTKSINLLHTEEIYQFQFSTLASRIVIKYYAAIISMVSTSTHSTYNIHSAHISASRISCLTVFLIRVQRSYCLLLFLRWFHVIQYLVGTTHESYWIEFHSFYFNSCTRNCVIFFFIFNYFSFRFFLLMCLWICVRKQNKNESIVLSLYKRRKCWWFILTFFNRNLVFLFSASVYWDKQLACRAIYDEKVICMYKDQQANCTIYT